MNESKLSLADKTCIKPNAPVNMKALYSGTCFLKQSYLIQLWH